MKRSEVRTLSSSPFVSFLILSSTLSSSAMIPLLSSLHALPLPIFLPPLPPLPSLSQLISTPPPPFLFLFLSSTLTPSPSPLTSSRMSRSGRLNNATANATLILCPPERYLTGIMALPPRMPIGQEKRKRRSRMRRRRRRRSRRRKKKRRSRRRRRHVRNEKNCDEWR